MASTATAAERSRSLSYPPLFRSSTTHLSLSSEEQHRSPPPPSPDPDVPVVDLERLDPARLGEISREWGLFRLVNHGVPSALSSRLQGQARDLLSLPFEAKQARFSHPFTYFWATPAPPLTVGDLHWLEGLYVPVGRLHLSEGDQELDGSVPSIRSDVNGARYIRSEKFLGGPTAAPYLWSLVEEYGQHMARIVSTLFDALAVDLKLDGEQSASYLSKSDATFRIYRYLCCPDASNCTGMEAHTDSSVLSVVNQDGVGGLQVLHGNQWLDVKPIPDTLIVNLGDMMQAISDDEYKSAKHRVLASGREERISLCYFSFPSEKSVITSSRYKPFTYEDFKAQTQQDIKATGSKVGLQRFRVKE